MGANWFGIAVYGADPSDVAARIATWMRQRGMDRQDGPPPRTLHASKERGSPHDVFVVAVDGVVALLRESSPEEMRAHRVVGPAGGTLVDRQLTVGGHPARWVAAVGAPGALAWSVTVWIHPPQRLFCFQISGQGDEPAGRDERIMALLRGLRLE